MTKDTSKKQDGGQYQVAAPADTGAPKSVRTDSAKEAVRSFRASTKSADVTVRCVPRNPGKDKNPDTA